MRKKNALPVKEIVVGSNLSNEKIPERIFEGLRSKKIRIKKEFQETVITLNSNKWSTVEEVSQKSGIPLPPTKRALELLDNYSFLNSKKGSKNKKTVFALVSPQKKKVCCANFKKNSFKNGKKR